MVSESYYAGGRLGYTTWVAKYWTKTIPKTYVILFTRVLAKTIKLALALKEWLLKLQVSQSSGTTVSQNLILIESVAEIEKSLRSRYDDKYQSIAQQQKDLFLGETSDTWQKEANKLLETLGSKAAHSLLPATGSSGNLPISCAHCQNAQPQHRCSRCKRVRYCNRQCQTADWQAGHRLTCLSSSSSS